MRRHPPGSTRTDSPFPSPPRFRSPGFLGSGRAAERGRELGEQAGADADDDGQHQHLDARCYDIAQHLFGEEGGLVEQSEGQQHEAGQRHQFELRSEEHTSELQSLMRISYAVFCLTKKIPHYTIQTETSTV